MNFMFEWQEQYLTSERSKRVRYCSCHENIKFISSSKRVMFFLLHMNVWYIKSWQRLGTFSENLLSAVVQRVFSNFADSPENYVLCPFSLCGADLSIQDFH